MHIAVIDIQCLEFLVLQSGSSTDAFDVSLSNSYTQTCKNVWIIITFTKLNNNHRYMVNLTNQMKNMERYRSVVLA